MLVEPALEESIQDCAFSSSSPDSFLNLVFKLLRCLSTNVSSQSPISAKVLHRLCLSLAESLELSTGAMHCVVGCCLLSVLNERSSYPDGSEFGEALQDTLLAVAQLHSQCPDQPIITYLTRLADLARERNLTQLSEQLLEHIELIRSGVLSMM